MRSDEYAEMVAMDNQDPHEKVTEHAWSDDVIQSAIDLHQIKGRTPWKYKPITPKQRERLAAYICVDKLSQIDRGAAAQMLTELFSRSREASAWESRLTL